MSVLIDMEMPTSCLECRLYNDPWCMAKNRNQWRTAYNRPTNGERQNDCPLVPVPPHGDLIDRDKIPYKKIMLDDDDEFYYGITQPYIDRMPVIIPAEEGET